MPTPEDLAPQLMRTDVVYQTGTDPKPTSVREDTIEFGFIGRLQDLKYGDAAQHMDPDNGNGFVWHTTGSGKTLTSFKASTFLKLSDSIHNCVFVVDRKDLDHHTREDWSSSHKTSSAGDARTASACSANQFNRFRERCVEVITNSAAFVGR